MKWGRGVETEEMNPPLTPNSLPGIMRIRKMIIVCGSSLQLIFMNIRITNLCATFLPRPFSAPEQELLVVRGSENSKFILGQVRGVSASQPNKTPSPAVFCF